MNMSWLLCHGRVLANHRTGQIHIIRPEGQAYCGRLFPRVPAETGFQCTATYPNAVCNSCVQSLPAELCVAVCNFCRSS
eukprot:3861949-Amphidinium_carterae.2